MTTLTAPSTLSARRVSPLATLRAGVTLAGRSIIRIRKNPESLVDVTLQPIIFLLMFVYIFGGAIAGNTHQYMQFLVPGLAVQNTVFASMGIGVALNTDITKGVFDRFRTLPIARSAPLIGAVFGDVVRYVLAVGWLLVFAAILGFRVQTGFGPLLLAIVLLVAFALCMCWITVFVGLLVRSPTAVQGLMMLVVFPLTFGSNVFANPATMPGWLRAWADVNPISKISEVSRGLMVGGPVAGPLGYAALWMVGLVAVFFPLAMWAYRRRVS
ncbi:ABC transporter permease [Sciscionella sediminilitoris]|uniref:ABC transporter permease n=1 Tax=Sciscionella sediminilitoris TaxID=1445613 RepID=UPI0004DF9FD5|nr:ABC transporter permease [Sciscionella sp. SE31]